jgi:hypothetical protein
MSAPTVGEQLSIQPVENVRRHVTDVAPEKRRRQLAVNVTQILQRGHRIRTLFDLLVEQGVNGGL